MLCGPHAAMGISFAASSRLPCVRQQQGVATRISPPGKCCLDTRQTAECSQNPPSRHVTPSFQRLSLTYRVNGSWQHAGCLLALCRRCCATGMHTMLLTVHALLPVLLLQLPSKTIFCPEAAGAFFLMMSFNTYKPSCRLTSKKLTKICRLSVYHSERI